MSQRVIKFRAWDKEKNEWFKPTYRAYAGELEDLQINLNGRLGIRDMTGLTDESRFPDRFILMQFTGLLDRNGKEIYEGDILKKMGTVHINPWYGVISDGLYDARSVGQLEAGSNMLKDEVIGNIYENPELLK